VAGSQLVWLCVQKNPPWQKPRRVLNAVIEVFVLANLNPSPGLGNRLISSLNQQAVFYFWGALGIASPSPDAGGPAPLFQCQ